MRTIIFGTYDTAMHPRIATIAEGLAARGVDVVNCNIPLGLSTADRVDMLAKPWKAGALAIRLASRWLGLAAKARRLRRPDAVVVGYLGHFDVHLARLLYRRGKVPLVLDHLISAAGTARDRRISGGGVKQRLLTLIDAAALRAADIVMVDTEEHLETVPERYRQKAVVVYVGAPEPWHAAAAEASAADAADVSGPLKVVFYGLYTPLQGTPVIGEALGRIAGAPVEVTMIGRGQDEAATKRAAAANTSVRWLDWVPAAELPALVAAHDVCLGIFGTSDKALRVVPNKVFQGAAAGCAVITSDTAPQRRVLGTVPQESGAVLVPPGDPAALADALLRLAGDRDALLKLRHAARQLAAQRFTPEQVVAPLTARLLPEHACS
ncbi:MAG TPA: glycosyltransferase family 4 protein [Trebonia sp.]